MCERRSSSSVCIYKITLQNTENAQCSQSPKVNKEGQCSSCVRDGWELFYAQRHCWFLLPESECWFTTGGLHSAEQFHTIPFAQYTREKMVRTQDCGQTIPTAKIQALRKKADGQWEETRHFYIFQRKQKTPSTSRMEITAVQGWTCPQAARDKQRP